VIITDSVALDGRPVGNLIDEFQRLADWKTRQGIPAVVRTVSWIRAHYAGPDDAAKVRAFLIDAYEQWGTDYVLLGGDGRIVPLRRFNGIALGAGHPPADVYYGGLDQSWDLDRDGAYGEGLFDAGASDPFWDVYVGRAPVEDRSEAHVFVERTLAYERAPGSDLAGLDPAYATRLLLLEGLGNCPTWGLACNGIYVGEVLHRRLAPAGFQRTRMYQQLLNPSVGCSYHQTYVEVGDSAQTSWTTNAAFNALNAGQGFVHHFEHSNPYEEGGASGGFGCAVTSGGALGREYIDQLTNRPNWSIVYSTGAGVNAIDYESVSEHWVLNPNGGAAAYVGKTRSGAVANTTGEVDTLFFANLFQDGMPVGQAMGIATQSVSISPIQAVASFNLLGDPALDPWTAAPIPIELSVSPAVLPLGEQEIAITVRDAGTQAPIADAMVALTSPALYVRGTTGIDGTVRFAVHLNQSATVTATAIGKNLVPATIAVPVGAGAQGPIAYVSHVALDDSAAVANGNAIADAGEGLKVDVALVNRGGMAVADAVARLDVIGAVAIHATLDLSCAPEQIFTGAFGHHGEDCGLRFPSDEFAGVIPHGRPAALAGTVDPGLFVWRVGSTWTLVARAPDGGPAGGRWQGGCRIPGVQELFLAGGLEVGDVASVVAPDSIAFDFVAQSTGDVDSLRFVAREGPWVSVPAAAAPLGTLGPASSATVRFLLATTSAIPDQHEIRCEVRVADGTGDAAGRSSFGLGISAPDLGHAAQSADVLAGTLLPSVRNLGLGGADQVTAILGLVAGPGTVLDSTVTFGAIPPQTTAPGADTWSFTGADSNLTRFTVEIVNVYPDGSVRAWPVGPLDLRRPCAPANLAAEPIFGGSARLRWTRPANECAPDLAGYHVYRQLSGMPGWDLVAGDGERDSTQIFQDVTLSPDTTWVYAVAAVDSSGNESVWSTVATTRSWVPERSGWPRAIDAGTPSSPLVVDVDDDGVQEIFALGNALYAWRADGSPLLPGSPDGTFFRPPRPVGAMSQGATGAFFGSPAAADLDGDGGMDVAIAAWDDSLWVLDAETGALRFGRRCVPKFSSPALGDLDGDGRMEVVIGSDTDTVYAWTATGAPLNPVYPSGALAPLPDGAIINYTTPALADIDGDPQTLEVIYATFKGHVYAWDGTGQLLWSADVGPDRPLSTPAIGDLDHDGTLEVVVAQGNVVTGSDANALYVIDAETGTVERSWAGSLAIPGAITSPGNYVHPPSLADLDGDFDLEIVLGTSGVTWPPPSSPLFGAATVLVFELEGGSSYALDCRDQIPLPGLNMTNVSQEIVNTQPVIANLDGDSDFELAVGSTTFGLFMFDVAPGLSGCAKEPGWPLLFAGEVESTPVICDLDGDGRFDLVTRANDGEVHVFALGADYAAEEVQWSQFGHDPRHTSTYTVPFTAGIGSGSGSPSVGRPFRLYPAAPNPTFAPARIRYELASQGRVQLTIYGVDGRLVRALVNEAQAPGPHVTSWDGRDVRGRLQPAGIYFYRLAARDGVVARKLLLMR
jgi:outer membrane protein assembly factor BamB